MTVDTGPGLPTGWRLLTLGDVARWGSGGTPRARHPRYYPGDIPWAVIGDLTDGPVGSTVGSITAAAIAESSAKLVPEGAVLIAMYGSIGKLGITTRPMATNQAIAFAVTHDRLAMTKYLFYYLMSQRPEFARAGKGATQQNIGQGILKAWPIPVPPIEEQRRIVDTLEDHLSRLDAAERVLEATTARLLRLRDQVIYRELFEGTSPSGTGSAAPPALVGLDDGVLPCLPGSWRWSRLGEVAEVVGGVTKDAKRQADPTYVEVPYLRVANVQRGRLDLSKITTIRVPQGKVDQLQLRIGDVLLNEGGDRDKLGRGWVWEGQIDPCIHQNHVFRARITGAQLRPRLLSWAANSYGGRWCERNGKQSVNLASISLSKIRLMPVPVPPVAEQAEIEARIQAALDGCDRLERAVGRARSEVGALRRSLLAAAFSGALLQVEDRLDRVEELAHV